MEYATWMILGGMLYGIGKSFERFTGKLIYPSYGAAIVIMVYSFIRLVSK